MIDAYKKIIPNEFARISKLTSLSSPWVKKIKTDKIWLCESVGKLKGIGKLGEAKMNEMNIHTISELQSYVRSYGFPKLPSQGFGRIMNMDWKLYPGNRRLPSNSTRKQKSVFLEIWREMGKKVKVFILHVEIMLYH